MKDKPFRNFFKIDMSYWLLVLPIFHVTVPWVQYRVRSMVPFVFAMMWLLPKISKIMARLSFQEGRAFLGAFIWFLTLMFMPEFFAIIGTQEHMQYYKVALISTQSVFFLVAFYTIACRKFNELRFLSVITLVGFLLAGVAAFRGLGSEVSDSARSVVGLQNSGQVLSSDMIDKAIAVYEIGLGGYGNTYNSAWLVGILLIAIVLTKNLKLRSFYAIVAVAAAVCVKTSGLGTPVGIVAVETIIFLIWACTRSRKLIVVCGYLLIVVFFMYAMAPQVFGFLADPMEAIASTMSDGSIKDRVISMAEAFRGEVSYANDRAQLQLISFRTFCKHPFLGAFGPFAGGSQRDLGGHSYLLDILGGYGLFGVLVYVMFIWSLLRYFHTLGRTYFGSRWMVLPVFYMGIFTFSAIMNPVTFFSNMVYLIPGIAYLSLSFREKENLWWQLEQNRWMYC